MTTLNETKTVLAVRGENRCFVCASGTVLTVGEPESDVETLTCHECGEVYPSTVAGLAMQHEPVVTSAGVEA
jgi:hypothetical protein